MNWKLSQKSLDLKIEQALQYLNEIDKKIIFTLRSDGSFECRMLE